MFIKTLTACLLLLSSAPALAADFGNDEADRLRDELKTQASQATTEVLRTHCQDRCGLIEVRAEVDVGQPLAHVQPGFEELSPQIRQVKARSIEVSVLLDARLPADFRKDLLGLLKARLKSLPAPVVIQADVVPFPQALAPPNPPAVDSKPPEVKPPPAEVKPPPAPEPKAAPAFDPWQALLERLIGAAPWLLGLLLIAATALLLVRALRAPLEESDDGPAPTPLSMTEKSDRPAPMEPPLAIAVQRLNDEFRDNPRLRVVLFKELLISGEEDKVARYVHLLGPGIADGLREDPSCRSALRRIGASLRAGTIDVSNDDAKRLLKELDGRLIAARLDGTGGVVDDAFAFLDKLTPSQFRRLIEEASARAQSAALRFAPAHLREASLAELDPVRRRSLFLTAAEAGVLSAPELTALADELRMKASRLAPGTDGTGLELLADLLESQGPSEQRALLDSLAAKPGMRQALQARLCTETTLLRMDEDALASATGGVEVTALVDYLRGADAAVKERILSVSPRPMADALREELTLAVQQTPAQFAVARRQVLQIARQVLQQRGASLEELNGSELRRVAG